MDLIETLGERDIDLIGDFLATFGSENMMSVRKYLMDWKEAKSKYLFNIFKNNFTLEKTFECARNESDLDRDFNVYLGDDNCFIELLESLRMASTYVLFKSTTYPWHMDLWRDPRFHFIELFDSFETNSLSSMRKNMISREIRIDPNENNYLEKKIVVSQNEKPFRFMRKVINIFKPICVAKNPTVFTEAFWNKVEENFEYSRLQHSRWLNEEKITGTLVLSIHPLDYLTMSDNSYDWNSCMMWTDTDDPGEYRCGVLEMMNSPSVVVAYIKGSKEYTIPILNEPWSNKKWRELFIVDHDFIAGIRGYPYQHDNIEEIILSWLVELCEDYGWDTYDKETHINGEESFTLQDHRFTFTTDFMYNDTIYHGTRMKVSTNPNFNNFQSNNYHYSGIGRCLVCGELITNPSKPFCNSCAGITICEKCGGVIYIDDDDYIMDDNGNIYCIDCAEYCNHCNSFHAPGTNRIIYVPWSKTSYACIDGCEDCLEELSPYVKEQIFHYRDSVVSHRRKVITQDAPLDLVTEFLNRCGYNTWDYGDKSIAPYEEYVTL